MKILAIPSAFDLTTGELPPPWVLAHVGYLKVKPTFSLQNKILVAARVLPIINNNPR
jgi:hypothetical protein